MRSFAPGLALVLAACGPELGEHRFVSARFERALPASVPTSRKDPGYVVLAFRTDADLNARDMNALYAKAASCGVPAGRPMTVIGPFTDQPVPEDIPLPGQRTPVTRYLVYVPLTGELWGDLENGKTPVVGRFDLRRLDGDVCFRLEHTGYPWATQTDAVRIPASVLRQAALAGVPNP